MRAGALGAALPTAPHAPLADLPLLERLRFAGRALLEGARLVVFPVRHSPNYRLVEGFHLGAPPGGSAWLGWGLWLALLAGGVLGFVRGVRQGRPGQRLVGASMAASALSLLPVLQIVPAGVVFAPRFLYLPLLFGAPAIGALLRRLPDVLFVVLLAVLVVGAWARTGVYADAESYHDAVLTHAPADVAAWNALGLAREEKGDLAGAHQAWRAAVQVDPGHSRTWSNLGRVAILQEDYEYAERALRRAVQVGSQNAVARLNLGSLLLRLKRYEEAESVYAEAARLAPGMAEAWRGLGHARLRRGDREGAARALQEALRLKPGDPRAENLLNQSK
jgi:Flp pilus assembly protein TadD